MIEKVELNCHNCGAPVNKRTMVCEYCGTVYKRDGEVISVFPLMPQGTKTICAEVRVEYGVLERHPEEGKKYVMDKLSRSIANELLKYMDVTYNDDPRDYHKTVRAKVEVVVPSQVAVDEKKKHDGLEDRIRRSWMSYMLKADKQM